MNENIIDYVMRFRKICAVLMSDRTKLKGEIYGEMGISGGTMKTLLEKPLDEEFHIYASVFGKVQDFVKKYAYYETLKPGDIKTKKVEKMKSITVSASRLPNTFRTTEAEIENEQTSEDYWFKVRALIEATPAGVTLTITGTKK